MRFEQTVDELRTAGLKVIAGLGHGQSEARGIDVVITKTAADQDGTRDLNGIVARRGATAYVRRSGEVWLLHDGPIDASNASIYVAAETDADVTPEQDDVVKVLLAVLGERYELPAPTPDPPKPPAKRPAKKAAASKETKS